MTSYFSLRENLADLHGCKRFQYTEIVDLCSTWVITEVDILYFPLKSLIVDFFYRRGVQITFLRLVFTIKYKVSQCLIFRIEMLAFQVSMKFHFGPCTLDWRDPLALSL